MDFNAIPLIRLPSRHMTSPQYMELNASLRRSKSMTPSCNMMTQHWDTPIVHHRRQSDDSIHLLSPYVPNQSSSYQPMLQNPSVASVPNASFQHYTANTLINTPENRISSINELRVPQPETCYDTNSLNKERFSDNHLTNTTDMIEKTSISNGLTPVTMKRLLEKKKLSFLKKKDQTNLSNKDKRNCSKQTLQQELQKHLYVDIAEVLMNDKNNSLVIQDLRYNLKRKSNCVKRCSFRQAIFGTTLFDIEILPLIGAYIHLLSVTDMSE